MSEAKRCTLKVAMVYHFLEVDGAVYTDMAYDYAHWREYLTVFDEVEIIARVGRSSAVPEGWTRADGPGVRFVKLPDYRGFWAFLPRCPRVALDCWRAARPPGAFLLCLGHVSVLCWLRLVLTGRPYAFDVLGHGGDSVRLVRNVQVLGLARGLAAVLHGLCRLQARWAALVKYQSVYLQRLYPSKTGREWVISDVYLPDDAFCPPRPAGQFDHEPKRIVCVGRVEPEKGHHVLIEAISRLKQMGRMVEYHHVGPGSQIEPLRRRAEELGLGRQVRFLGRVSREELLAALDAADLFVLPSLTEGMPRALLEAMARGLPAIGSRAGGIGEALPDECLVPPGDAGELALKLADVLSSSDRLAAMSALSVQRAHDWCWEEMQSRKRAFWECARTMTQPESLRAD